jgi:hypothetical protein
VTCALVVSVVPVAREASKPVFAAARSNTVWPLAAGREDRERDDALRRARVWTPVDPARADVRSNPPDPRGTLSAPLVRCQFLPEAARGTTPKFDCVLPDGEVVKVKYGRMTAEIHAEVAASRLLRALGFGADEMFVVPRVRCYGCPRFPFETAEVLERIGARERFVRLLPEDRYVDFQWAAVERRFAGHEILAPGSDIEKGWAWYEFDRIDPNAGASRAELDALRLLAAFLVHWDNKAENQRLVCLDSPPAGAAPCRQPFALLHDVGATFGPRKMDLEDWSETPVWADAAACRVSMKQLPYGGGTFPDAQISEDGRQLALRQLAAFSEAQIASLFDAARFGAFMGWRLTRSPVEEWARVFRAKVADIRAAGPCASH